MTTDSRERIPRATIHKQILDAAAANPDASIDALAEEVAGASADLVERVLAEYGDPTAADEIINADASGDDSADQASLSAVKGLSDEQRATLEAIHRHPEATQAELADKLGVSASTVNRRLNKIEGFEWSDRIRIIQKLGLTTPDPSRVAVASDGGATAESARPESESTGAPTTDDASPSEGSATAGTDMDTTTLVNRLERIERRVNELTATSDDGPGFDDPELAAKVVLACTESDVFDDDEELQVIKTLLGALGE